MSVLSAIEIIAETVAFYGEDTDRRGLDCDGDCLYRTADGKECAVGRCMIDSDNVEPAGGSPGSVWGNEDMDAMDSDLYPQYRGQSMRFWSRLQDLHDTDENWNDDGITVQGQLVADRLKKEFA